VGASSTFGGAAAALGSAAAGNSEDTQYLRDIRDCLGKAERALNDIRAALQRSQTFSTAAYGTR
jgi:hypothetical protein